MKKLEGYSSRIERLTELVAQLESGNLTIEELSEMETITRELHERSIILRYNAFKDQVMPDAEADDYGAILDEDGGVEVEVIIEEIDENDANASDGDPIAIGSTEEEAKASDRESTDDLTIDFSIFDDEPAESPEPEVADATDGESTDDIPQVEPVIEPEPEVIETPEPVAVVEPEVIPEPVKEEPVEAKIDSSAAQSFLDKLKIEDNSVASRFTHSKLDSLIGAFGLNERLRYINDLFDGSSEIFSDAIKALDSQSSLEAANLKAANLATEHEWDPEEEIVVEFMTYINRRYA